MPRLSDKQVQVRTRAMRSVAPTELATFRHDGPWRGRRQTRSVQFQVAAALLLSGVLIPCSAFAQTAKEMKVKAGQSVVLVNMVNPRPDCSTNPGPVALPNVSKPASGTV